MKKIVHSFLVLFMAGGLHATAEDRTAATPDTNGAGAAAGKERPAAPPRRSIAENFFYGGYINLSFGSYTVIGIEPMVGYKLTPKLSTGVKVRYDYIRDDRYPETRTTSTYGGSIFARYLVTPKFYAQVEPATYNYEFFYAGGGSEREWVPLLLVGGGYIQPLSERTWLNVQILLDVMNDEKSPYDDWQPFFSIGIGAGL